MCVLAVLSTLNSNSVVRLCADAVWANTRSITHVVNVWGGHSICHQVTCCCYVTRRPDGTSDPDCLQKKRRKNRTKGSPRATREGSRAGYLRFWSCQCRISGISGFNRVVVTMLFRMSEIDYLKCVLTDRNNQSFLYVP